MPGGAAIFSALGFLLRPHLATYPSPRSARISRLIRHASTWIPPVPCAEMFSAMVPIRGFLARIIGSMLGRSAVPQPSHARDFSVAPLVRLISAGAVLLALVTI